MPAGRCGRANMVQRRGSARRQDRAAGGVKQVSQASLGKDHRVGREKFSIASQLLLQRALEHAIYVCSLAYGWLKWHVFLMHFCSAL